MCTYIWYWYDETELNSELVLLGVGGRMNRMDNVVVKRWARELYTLANWWFLCFVLGGMLMNY
jgi:hypothetical protein